MSSHLSDDTVADAEDDSSILEASLTDVDADLVREMLGSPFPPPPPPLPPSTDESLVSDADDGASFLYDADQNQDGDDNLGVESLHCAVFRQDVVAVERLLAVGVDPDEPDWVGSGDPPIMLAVTNGNVPIVRALCAAGCNVNARRVNGQSALMLSVVTRASRRSPRVLLGLLEQLLTAGADPNLREKLRGQTPLHALAKAVAADARDPHLLSALRTLARVADVNAQDHRKRTALHVLAGQGCHDPEPYNVLLEAKADASLQTSRGDTPLVEYLELERDRDEGELSEAVLRLLASGVRPTTQYGETALHVAARRNRASAVRIALAAGADPRDQDLRGNTPLHLAAARGYTTIVSLLLASPETDINATNREGYTPLHVAVESGFVDVVDALLRADGVDVTLVTEQGQSVLDLARQEYRLRAHPQLAVMLAMEVESRSCSPDPDSCSRSSGCWGSSSSGSDMQHRDRRARASVSTLGDSSDDYHFERTKTPSSTIEEDSISPNIGRMSTSRRRGNTKQFLSELHEDQINYLGSQVTCLGRVEPKYSPGDPDPLPDSCREHTNGSPSLRPNSIDFSLKEEVNLMRSLCLEQRAMAAASMHNLVSVRRTQSSASPLNCKFRLSTDLYTAFGERQGLGFQHHPDLDASDLVVESLLAVAKSITEPISSEPECDQLPRYSSTQEMDSNSLHIRD